MDGQTNTQIDMIKKKTTKMINMENKYTNEKKTENTVKSKKQLNAVTITSKNVVWILSRLEWLQFKF